METLLKDSAVLWGALVIVMVVSVGMYTYNSASSSIHSAMDEIEDTETVIDTSENDAFNTQFEPYIGEISGIEVKSLISVLISNANIYSNFDDRLPDLYYEATRGNQLVITSTEGDTNIDDFATARQQIESGHDYYVSVQYSDETGFIDTIKISYDRLIYGE